MPVRCVFIGDRLKGQRHGRLLRGQGRAGQQDALERGFDRAEPRPRITSSSCLRATQVMARALEPLPDQMELQLPH